MEAVLEAAACLLLLVLVLLPRLLAFSHCKMERGQWQEQQWRTAAGAAQESQLACCVAVGEAFTHDEYMQALYPVKRLQ